MWIVSNPPRNSDIAFVPVILQIRPILLPSAKVVLPEVVDNVPVTAVLAVHFKLKADSVMLIPPVKA